MVDGVTSFSDLVSRSWRDNVLLSVLLELTYGCTLDCAFCYNDREAGKTPLSTGQYLDLLEELREMEVLNLTISGGEPLAHRDFFTIGSRAHELGFVVRVKSNATLIDDEVAARIRDEIDPFVIEVSMHGACAATHERQTRVAGSFARLMLSLRSMVVAGLRVRLGAVLTRWNEHELEAMFDLADSLALPLRVDPVVTPRDDGNLDPLDLSPSREAQERLACLLAQRARAAGVTNSGPQPCDGEAPHADGAPAMSKHCGAASAGVAVDPWGNVLPCVQWRAPLGNLHGASMRKIWQGSAVIADVRRLTAEAYKLVASYGPPASLMRFCPGLADRTTGDPLAVSDADVSRMRIAEQALAEFTDPQSRS